MRRAAAYRVALPVLEDDVAGLLAGLAALRCACEMEQWELAYTLMHEHDCRLRAVLELRPTRALAAVLAAQQALMADMAARRDAAAGYLVALRRSASAAGIYHQGDLQQQGGMPR